MFAHTEHINILVHTTDDDVDGDGFSLRRVRRRHQVNMCTNPTSCNAHCIDAFSSSSSSRYGALFRPPAPPSNTQRQSVRRDKLINVNTNTRIRLQFLPLRLILMPLLLLLLNMYPFLTYARNKYERGMQHSHDRRTSDTVCCVDCGDSVLSISGSSGRPTCFPFRVGTSRANIQHTTECAGERIGESFWGKTHTHTCENTKTHRRCLARRARPQPVALHEP